MSVNLSVPTSFLAGVISFLSPCVLPLVPGYVSLITGASIEQLRAAEEKSLARTVLANSLGFVAGFSTVFVALGASASWVGQLLLSHKILLYRIAGIIIVLFGLHLVGLLKVAALYREKRFQPTVGKRGVIGAFVLGLAFAFGWTPCIGPILGAMLAIAATRETIYQGIFLLAVYSLGLAVPFVLTALGINRFLSFYGRFRKHLHAVEVFSGALLIVVGVMIFTNSLTRLAGYLSFLNRFAL